MSRKHDRRPWDSGGLFTFFTQRLDPEIRMSVLRAVADPDIPLIAHVYWNCDGDCCPLVLAAIAATHEEARLSLPVLRSLAYTITMGDIAKALGITILKVKQLAKIWDGWLPETRIMFRTAIGAYAQVTQQNGEPPTPENVSYLIGEIEDAHSPVITSTLVSA